jgi:hypothetical protein
MDKQPYFYPPKFHQICDCPRRKKVFSSQYPEHDCVMDPYYPERVQIHREIERDFKENKSDNIVGSAQNGRPTDWAQSMRKVYKRNHVKTPYNFYRPFIHQVSSILHESPDDQKAEILYNFVNRVYESVFVPDPFYSFYSILDFLLYELIAGKNDHDEKVVLLPISDQDFVQFVYLLIVNSYIGITQFRFLIYMTVVLRDDPRLLKMLLSLIEFLDIPLTQNIGDDSLKVKVYKRLLMIDALEFSYVQLKLDTVNFLVQDCGVPLEDMNPKVLGSMQNLDTLSNLGLNYTQSQARLLKKYYFRNN